MIEHRKAYTDMLAYISTEYISKGVLWNLDGQKLWPVYTRAVPYATGILSQTYCTQGGLSRAVRENCTGLLLFKNKQEQQLEKIKTEMCSCVNEEVFNNAYKEAIQKPFDNLYIDFNPKHPDMTFRKNLNLLLIFDENELG